MTAFPRTVLRRMSLSLGIVFLVLLGFGLVSVRAQGAPGQIDSNPLAAISAQLARIIAAVSPSGPATLNTGALFGGGAANALVGCAAANVGTATITYEFTSFNSLGVATGSGSGTLLPGRTNASAGTSTGSSRCQFIVSDAASFRGTLVAQDQNGNPLIALEAH